MKARFTSFPFFSSSFPIQKKEEEEVSIVFPFGKIINAICNRNSFKIHDKEQRNEKLFTYSLIKLNTGKDISVFLNNLWMVLR